LQLKRQRTARADVRPRVLRWQLDVLPDYTAPNLLNRCPTSFQRPGNLAGPVLLRQYLHKTSLALAQLLRHHDKDMSAVYDVPVAPVVIPISVLMSVPIRVIVVVVGMHRRPVSSTHRRAPRPVHDFSSVRFLERCGHGPEREYQHYGFHHTD
jgi:hypothetical protein